MDNRDAVEISEQNVEPKKKKKDKVRSAWISFAGRIVAQLVGAIATVALGVMVLHRYTSSPRTGHPNAAAALGAPPAVHEPAASSVSQPAVHVVVLTPAMLGLADADQRMWPTDRSCTPALDAATSPAHFDTATLLPR